MESQVDGSTEGSTATDSEKEDDPEDGAGTEEQVATTEGSAKEGGDRVEQVGSTW